MSSGTTHEAAAGAAGQAAGPAASSPPRPGIERVPPGGAWGAIVALTILLGLVLTAFTLPAINSEPRGVPSAWQAPLRPCSSWLERSALKRPKRSTVTTFTDDAQLSQAIRDREVYGGIALGPSGATILTAPAASPLVAQGLSSLAAQLGQQQGRAVPVKEVVSLPAEDSRGAGLATALLPLLIGAIAPVLAMNRLVRGTWAKLGAVLTTAARARGGAGRATALVRRLRGQLAARRRSHDRGHRRDVHSPARAAPRGRIPRVRPGGRAVPAPREPPIGPGHRSRVPRRALAHDRGVGCHRAPEASCSAAPRTSTVPAPDRTSSSSAPGSCSASLLVAVASRTKRTAATA